MRLTCFSYHHLQLHMISNREKIESEILRGRQKVRSQIGRARRLTNPESEPAHEPTPLPTAAVTPSHQDSPPPSLEHRPSIPIDSDAETKYNDEWQRLKKREGEDKAQKVAGSSSHRSYRDAAVGLGGSTSSIDTRPTDRRRRGYGRGKGRPSQHRTLDTDESTDPRSSDAENGGGPPSAFASLGSSFRRMRPQSFSTLHLPWSTNPRARETNNTSPYESTSPRAASSALPRRNSGQTTRSRKRTPAAAGQEDVDDDGYSAYSSSEDDEDDEDELRVLQGDYWPDEQGRAGELVEGLPLNAQDRRTTGWSEDDEAAQVDSDI